MQPQTRERLVGLLLLALMAAILSPLIFRSPEEVRLALDMDIPDAPEVQLPQFNAAVPEEAVQQAEEAIESAREELLEVAEQNPEREPLEVQSTEEQAAVPSGWAVQVASFTVERAARELAQRLRDEDYTAYVRQVEQDDGPLFRVFVGPELSRGSADRLRDQLASDTRFKLPGLVKPYEL